MNNVDYLVFRRKIVIIDKWLSYIFLAWIYYYFEERNLYILYPLLISIGIFNLVGYIYLCYLESNYQQHKVYREPLNGLLAYSKQLPNANPK